jgi:glycosyltransferase involved in cell wall biosynthesis
VNHLTHITLILPDLSAGGAERVALTYLRQLDRNNCTVSIVVFEDKPDLVSLVPEGVPITNLRTIKTSRSLRRMVSVLRNTKPTVVFTTHSRVALLISLIRPICSRFFHIARLQSTPSLERRHGYYGSSARLLYGFGFRRADLVIAQTEHMKRDAVHVFGLKESKMAVLPNPLDTNQIDEAIRNTSSPFPNDQISALAAGRLSYAKGFDVLISALPGVVRVHANFVLYILGNEGGEGPKLRALADKLDLSDNVRFLGFHSNPYRYYRFCDLFVLSSRWEGFPNVLLENHYLNTPIVATRCVPIVEELVRDGVNGYLCSPEDVPTLTSAIANGISLRRDTIRNSAYCGGRFENALSRFALPTNRSQNETQTHL